METVIVTGAAGFLGRAVCLAFRGAGFKVRAIVRNPGVHQELEKIAEGGVFSAELPDRIDEAAFRGEIGAIVHCAYSTVPQNEKAAHATNVRGTEILLRAARRAGVRRFVFVSSLAAHENATSVYGRTKFQLETLFTTAQDTVIRPGTIVGSGGVFHRTRELIRRLPVLPLLYGDRKLQTVWVDDVCSALLEIVRAHVSGTLMVAHPEPISVQSFYRSIAAMDGRHTPLVPFPGDVALCAVRMLEKFGLRLPITSDNLLGIKHLRVVDPTQDLRRLGLQPLSFRESLGVLMARSGD